MPVYNGNPFCNKRLVFHISQSTYNKEINAWCLSQGHNDIMPCSSIKTATLRLLNRRANQLSYAAASRIRIGVGL